MPLIWFDACFIHDRISWFENETALPKVGGLGGLGGLNQLALPNKIN
ncbi:hypothetical protein H1P_4890003 [Hyella patelloides LEGE 07179]|uniref:Uncharacterized protein n=1 Tax=Hyella patelloides LEGE 07179 TaxID=945734 RepID=A0A563VZ35_9CYAN|nr:hypothetical protein [Hyella patelloides]VEP16718.1 hypothetical protein H1P_4890003 [Hyella patelloides LEGE 07179]